MNRLVQHAISTVWCNPSQDKQYVIKPAPLQSTRGWINTASVMKRNLELPTRGARYFLFQIGQLNPAFLGLLARSNSLGDVWVQVSECCTQQKCIIDIYNETGMLLPKHEVYYTFTVENNLIVAIKENKNFHIRFGHEAIYLRFYSNAYFQSLRSDREANTINIAGTTVETVDDILTWQNRHTAYSSSNGHCFVYINGYLKNAITLLNTKIGDCVELVYDSSIKTIVEFTVPGMPEFLSDLDNLRKYLLHYELPNDLQIDYFDDIDFYVIDRYVDSQYRGLYYHRNSEKAVRMITHRDYAVPVSYIAYYARDLARFHTEVPAAFTGLKILLFIRNSGYERALDDEANRIKELYKLPDRLLQNALIGTNAVVPCWAASALEISGYTRLMRSNLIDITMPLIKSAYGYNALSNILGQTPSKIFMDSGRPACRLPYGLQNGSTAYEYDQDGVLLGIAHHIAGEVHTALYDNTRLIEVITGIGDYTPSVAFGRDNVTLPVNADYRIYKCHRDGSLLTGPWVDITNSTDYLIINNCVVLKSNESSYIMVRDDSKFLAYELIVAPTDGNIRFTLSEMEQRNGLLGESLLPAEFINETLPVPMGELTLFLNGRSLIENLDYFYIFPEVVITNKKYLTENPNSQYQKVTVRYTNFYDDDPIIKNAIDIGFIEYGFLSNNNRFDIRDDRVLRIIVDGRLYHRSDLLFSEEHSGVSINTAMNGRPYSITDIVVPLRDYMNETMPLRKEAIRRDSVISSYLSRQMPQPNRSGLTPIAERYPVFSPFLSKLVYDIFTEHLNKSQFDTILTDQTVLTICKNYEGWLEFDPTQEEHAIDSRYIIIHPHNHYNAIDLSLGQYRFIQQVNRLYCRGLVELSPFFSIIA